MKNKNLKDFSELINAEDKRPWGYFKKFCENSSVTVKIIKVNPNEELSYQSHHKRSEFWKVISGDGSVILDDKIFKIKTDAEILIPVKTKHKLIAGKLGIDILEISFGFFDESDIIRYSDKYKRV